VERGALLDAVGLGMTELLNLAWNAFMRSATTADALRAKAVGVSAARAAEEVAPSELHQLQAEVTILRAELERSESRGSMLMQQVSCPLWLWDCGWGSLAVSPCVAMLGWNRRMLV
jgi:hypothetical protein